MHELIEIYLTDRLTPEQEERFFELLSEDKSFRDEFELSLAALAMADFSMNDDGDIAVPDFVRTECQKL